jgi:hypothetical protein
MLRVRCAGRGCQHVDGEALTVRGFAAFAYPLNGLQSNGPQIHFYRRGNAYATR